LRSALNSQHRVQWPPLSWKTGGACSEQRGMASGQRGWNRQPAGGVMRLGGWPRSSAGPVLAARAGSGAEEISNRV
jgi:hypothetical protein